MERKTFIDNDGFYIDGINGKVWSDIRGRFRGKAIDRLAAYEDTGLEPGAIKSLLAEFKVNLAALDSHRKAKKVKTNADKIRQMSDEELANWVWSAESDGRAYGPIGKSAWLDWLKQEVESNADQ